jgi:hypothetical protein
MSLLLNLSLALTFAFVDPTYPVIKNQTSPAGPAQTIVFTEELRIGADPDQPDLDWIDGTVSVAVGSNGHMYVVDPKENRITQLDEKGEIVKMAGGLGEGPGEFQGLQSLSVLKNGDLLAFENNGGRSAFTWFDSNLKFKDKKVFAGQGRTPLRVIPSTSADLMGAIYMEANMETGGIFMKTGLLTMEGKVVEEMSSQAKTQFDPSKIMDGNYWVTYLGNEFKYLTTNRGIFAADHSGNFYSAKSKEYAISLLNAEGEIEKQITRDYEPLRLTEENRNGIIQPIRDLVYSQLPQEVQQVVTERVIQKGIEKAEFPAHQQPVYGIIPMEDGGFLVVHALNFATYEATADIYSAKGKFLGQVTRGNNSLVNVYNPFHTRMTFRNGKAYTMETNEDSENQVVRYSYKLKKAN